MFFKSSWSVAVLQLFLTFKQVTMMVLAILCLVLPLVTVSASTNEVSCSRFDYEYRVMEQLVTLTNRLVDLEKSNAEKDRTIQNLTEEIRRTKNTSVGGSVYVRWGRKECPLGNGTELIYKGYAGGSHFSHTGAAANYICLPEEPTWSNYSDAASTASALVYGAEYQFDQSKDPALMKFFLGAHDHDVPCAVCRSQRPAMVMIPGRKDCYESWTLEYNGYLSAGHYGHASASEYVCLDRHPEAVEGGHTNHDGVLFYLVEARCGSLKCPPYVNARELSCVVCTK